MSRAMCVLVASDGSASAAAGLDAAVRFPWPEGSRTRGVAALESVLWAKDPAFRAAIERSLRASADETLNKLRKRWPDAEVTQVQERALPAILGEARRFGADAIVLGWRGHGAFARLLAGSVSRSVAERAKCSVLIVREGARGRRRIARRFLVGYDGSENSRKAIRFMARLQPPPGNRIVLVNVMEPAYTPALSRVAKATRAHVRAALEKQKAMSTRQCEKRLQGAAAILRDAGWAVTTRLRTGASLHGLLAEAAAAKAEVVVVGARGATGFKQLLLGSVASALLNQSPFPVMIAR